MFTFFGNVSSVLIVYSFTNKNSFHGTLMLEKDMFRVYWKKRCSSIPVLSKSTSNAWFDVVGLFRLSSESETSQGLVCDKVMIITPRKPSAD